MNWSTLCDLGLILKTWLSKDVGVNDIQPEHGECVKLLSTGSETEDDWIMMQCPTKKGKFGDNDMI